jgi:hypothetical protein
MEETLSIDLPRLMKVDLRLRIECKKPSLKYLNRIENGGLYLGDAA